MRCGLAADRGAAQVADDDAPGLVLAPGSIRVREGRRASYTVALASQPTGTVTVTMTTDLTATDLTVDSPVLSFTADNWNLAQVVNVTAAEDADAADDPAVTLLHSASGGGYDGASPAAITVTIVEPPVPMLSVAGGSADEGGRVNFVVTMSLSSSRRVVVEYETADGTAVSPDDFTATRSSLVFSPGETSKTVQIATRDDLLSESSETFSLRLSSPQNAQIQAGAGAATGTILDVVPVPTAVTLSLGRHAVPESAAGTAVAVTVTLAGVPAPQATQVTIAVEGGTATPGLDYAVLRPLVVTIPQGQASAMARLWFDPAEDGEAEGNETVILAATAAGLAGGRAILTIIDSEPPLPQVSLSLDPQSVSESASLRTVTVTASLPQAAERRTRVNVSVTGGTASPGTDYRAVPAFTVTISEGLTSATHRLHFEPLNDDLEECSETVLFTGSGPHVNPVTAMLRIRDDDVTSPADCGEETPSITLWTDRLAYAIHEEIRLYLDTDPRDHKLDYTFFFYLEHIETGQRFYFAPSTGSLTLWDEVVDHDGGFEGAWWPARAQRVETELIWQGRAPRTGLWHFVAEIRNPGATQVLKRVHAKFMVPPNGPLLVSRRGTDRILASDTLWTSDRLYNLAGRVYVSPDTTLTIEAGTVINASREDAAIIVQEGGRIVVRGRREAPVVMTCNALLVGERAPGCWGGLRVHGTAAADHGAGAPDDSSGELRYLRVEFAGSGSIDDGPASALALHGVGSRTLLDHVQVHASAGDGFSFRGGTVNCTYCVASDVMDKSFAWSAGWEGSVQHMYVQQGSRGAAALHGSADSGAAAGEVPSFDNVTLIGGYNVGLDGGAPGSTRTIGPGIHLNGEAGLAARNVLVMGFAGFAIEGPESSFADGRTSVTGAILTNSGYVGSGSSEVSYQLRPHVEYIDRDPELVNVRYEPNPDPRPRSGSIALRLGSAARVPFDSDFARPTRYVGAFHTKNWLEEWTFFGPEDAYRLPDD